MNRKYLLQCFVIILGCNIKSFSYRQVFLQSNVFVHSYQYTLLFLPFSKECSSGYFGEQCNGICGHCKDISACHHITGTCAEGCVPGYRFPKCTEGIYHTVFKKYRMLPCAKHNIFSKDVTNQKLARYQK